jgi:diadenosine tetraphosphatase ApaH/serine/threonine PP2A family protein phosphatase
MSPADEAKNIALMGGAYGNVPALEACLADAERQQCDILGFLGDAIGCCGHSDEIVSLVRERFDIRIAGNHERQAASGKDTCGCGYENEEDERISCMAYESALESLSEANRKYLGTWPEHAFIERPEGRLLLCHGSPERTNEFLYESEVKTSRLDHWLTAHGCRGLACTHTGLPWVKRWNHGRFAVNCGVTGKPDHDGDPAVHYAIIEASIDGLEMEIRRVTYDHETWAHTLEQQGVDSLFIEPLRTGIWTTGRKSLPAEERHRHATV